MRALIETGVLLGASTDEALDVALEPRADTEELFEYAADLRANSVYFDLCENREERRDRPGRPASSVCAV